MKSTIKKLRQLLINLRSAFEPITLEEVMVHETEQAILTIQQTSRTIKQQEYLKHMAKSKLNAIDDYRAGNLA